MKTRIVYPQMWLDEKFAECKQSTKLLFLYLITNNYLGLSPYTHLNDRQIMFDTGLNSVQLEEGKRELEQLRWVYFKDGWLFHNHTCAYIDYVRNERVEQAKEAEVKQVPLDIAQYFNEICLNKVQTVLEQGSNLNHKSETINHKSEIKNNSLESVKTFLAYWNETYGTKYTSAEPLLENFNYWLTQYSIDDIRRAVQNIKLDKYWKDKMTPTIFLRRKNPRNEAVDYIGEMLNIPGALPVKPRMYDRLYGKSMGEGNAGGQ